MVLADRHEPPARGIEAEVGVAERTLGRDRHGRGVAWVAAVEPAIGQVREDDRAAGHDI
jgi:hypothetical protein